MLWTSLLPLALVLGVIFCFVRWLAYGKLTVRTPADWGNVLLLIVAVLSLWITALPEKTTVQVLRLLAGMAMFYAIVNWGNSKDRVGWLIVLLLIAGVGLSLSALIGVDWVSEKATIIPNYIYARLPVRVSDPAHPNVMAGSLVLFAPLFLALILFSSKPPFGKIIQSGFYVLSIISLIIVLSVIVLTLSRGAILAFFLSVLLLIAMRWKWGWVTGLAIVFIVLIIAGFGGASWLENILDHHTLGTLVARLELWSRAISVVQLFPFTGVGMGLFKEIIGYLMPLIAVEGVEIVHAHNLFLQIAIDMGLPGLVAWISIQIVVLTVAWNLYKTGLACKEQWVIGLGVGLLGSCVAMITHGMVDAVVWGLRSAPMVWVFWGVTIAAGRVYLMGYKVAKSESV